MVKTFGLVAVAAVAALVLGFGSHLVSSTPTASADTTDVAVVGCEFIASAVDGDTTNTTGVADVVAACGIGGANLPPTGAISIASLAGVGGIGDQDGELEKSDFADIEGFDNNEISEDCTAAALYCTLDVFVFVDDEKPVTIDPDAGLKNLENGTTNDFICNTAGVTLGLDNDCDDTVTADGDGVVLFHILADTADRGDVLNVNVIQETVEQNFDVNVVGAANELKLALVEDTIGTSGSTANRVACVGDEFDNTTPGGLGIPGVAVDSAEAVTDANSTIAFAQAFDQDDNLLARVPVDFSIDPASASGSVVSIALGNPLEGVTGNTKVTLDPGNDIPIAAYVVLCGGNGTGTATIQADFTPGSVVAPVEDHSEADITVVGAAKSVALTASASQIKCDSTETSTVTATVTDSAGNNVADGTPVTFSVVALGTANPISTVTKDGVATSVITPLSNSSAGVTVIVTAGDDNVATEVQTSTLIGCTLPLATQPTLVPAVPPTATPRAGVTGPDTGNGGYLGQDGSGFPMWTLIVLALGSLTLVGGATVARRAGK